MPKGKALAQRVANDVKAARERGRSLQAMHPLEVAAHLDPMTQDMLYPATFRQAKAKARLSPGVWQMGVRTGWLEERNRRQGVSEVGAD